MKKQVLFIQGAGEGAYRLDKKLADNLQQLLGSKYQVAYPKMQDEGDPNYATWNQQIKGEIAKLEGNDVILVGHSVGGSMLIKLLTESNIDKNVTGIFLISTPFWGDTGWTYEGFETLMLQEDAATKLSKHTRIFLYHSRDDEMVSPSHLALYAQKLPRATLRALDGPRGHQLNDDLSEVANDIKSLWSTDIGSK